MKQVVKTPVVTPENDMTLSLPSTVHIELTTSCCFNCRHCYNFWRKEKTKPVSMSGEQLDRILDEIIKNDIMHVIFTGGEPLINSSVLLHGLKRLKEARASVSCNSSLAVLSSIERLSELKAAGLEHILTSLNSHRPDINDYLVSTPGAYKKIIEGIKNAVSAGIRISVNMIISESNIGDMYETAALASRLGAKKFFGTRVVPHLSDKLEEQKEFLIYQKEAGRIVNELMRVRKDFSMQVGTLVPYPFCFIVKGDRLEDYRDFYSHGCPAGNKMISLNANGDAHACVHESKNYGNILEIGIKGVWEKMNAWRSGVFFPDACKRCPLFDECNGGCRLCAEAYNGDISAPDNLKTGWKGGRDNPWFAEYSKLKPAEIRCSVPKDLRFIQEKGFSAVNRFGSETLCVKDHIAKILKEYQKNQKIFFPADIGLDGADLVKTLLKERLLIIKEN